MTFLFVTAGSAPFKSTLMFVFSDMPLKMLLLRTLVQLGTRSHNSCRLDFD